MSNKIPTAHEMRLRSQKNEVGTIPLEELLLYKECLRRLQENTGHCGVTRVVCGVYTDKYVDVCIEPGTGSPTIDRVSDALKEQGFHVSWETGKNSGFAGRDTLRICWGALPHASYAGLPVVDGKVQDPCKNCAYACRGKDTCYMRRVFDDIARDMEAEKSVTHG